MTVIKKSIDTILNDFQKLTLETLFIALIEYKDNASKNNSATTSNRITNGKKTREALYFIKTLKSLNSI